jgi:MoaA/NifB/PqqE/SkfB family radical SAM enzyme
MELPENDLRLEQIGFSTLTDFRAKNASPTSPLKRCEMILTNRCNFRCPYCQGLPPLINRAMTWEEIRETLAFWIDDQAENIRFSGGEPALHPRLLDAISLCNHEGVRRIGLTTNGSKPIRYYQQLIDAGLTDLSISLDACTPEKGDEMMGNLPGVWGKVVRNIRDLSKRTAVIINVVYNEANVAGTVQTILFAHELGVKDILLVSASQYSRAAGGLQQLPKEVLDAHPILKYRVENALHLPKVRGLSEADAYHCALVLDDAVVAADYHFPCSIYMRERGNPIGRIGAGMRQERASWFQNHNTHQDAICKEFCVDLYRDYNNAYRRFHPG